MTVHNSDFTTRNTRNYCIPWLGGTGPGLWHQKISVFFSRKLCIYIFIACMCAHRCRELNSSNSPIYKARGTECLPHKLCTQGKAETNSAWGSTSRGAARDYLWRAAGDVMKLEWAPCGMHVHIYIYTYSFHQTLTWLFKRQRPPPSRRSFLVYFATGPRRSFHLQLSYYHQTVRNTQGHREIWSDFFLKKKYIDPFTMIFWKLRNLCFR